MAMTFDQLFAVDPSNPANVAVNASVLIFAPGDTAKAPLTLTTPDGSPLANPVTVNANGFGPAFAHATLDRVAWEGGGFTGFFTSYEGMKTVATDAQAAAEASATSAANSANLVGAPADAAIATAMSGAGTQTNTTLDTAVRDKINLAGSATQTALNATVDARSKAQSKTADALALDQSMAFAARQQPLSRWRNKLASSPSTAVICGMGDSTTDEIVEAVNLWTRLRTYHTASGQGLAGMATANIKSFGHNGSKLADWWTTSAWKTEITGSGAHLVVLSYGINDFRLGATTQAAFRALLIQVVDYLRLNMPTTDIVLRIPNSFTSDNTDAYAVGWVSPATAEASQKYSTELRNVYLSLIGYWPDGVAVWDAQGRIFGVTAKPKADMGGLMKDILHPSATVGYPAIADALVTDLIGADAVPAVSSPLPKAVLDIVGRADSTTTPGTTTSGHVYEVPNGTFGVLGYQLYLPTAVLSRALVETKASNYEAGVTFAVVASGQTLHFRYSSASVFCYLANTGGTSYELYSYNSAATLIGVVSGVTPANGDRIKLQVEGTLCRIYVNEVLRNSYTIPASPGTKVGIQATTTVPRWTDLYVKPF